MCVRLVILSLALPLMEGFNEVFVLLNWVGMIHLQLFRKCSVVCLCVFRINYSVDSLITSYRANTLLGLAI